MLHNLGKKDERKGVSFCQWLRNKLISCEIVLKFDENGNKWDIFYKKTNGILQIDEHSIVETH